MGSTAVPHSLTKGVQVRVTSEQFQKSVQILSRLYELNEGSVKTDCFRAFKDDSTVPPLGIQLTIIDSEYDFFGNFAMF